MFFRIIIVILLGFSFVASQSKELRARVFIRPNGLSVPISDGADEDDGAIKNYLYLKEILNSFGVAIKTSSLFVDIATDWEDQGWGLSHPDAPTLPYNRLPILLFKNKKEGDVVSLEHVNEQGEKIQIMLTLKQIGCPYQDCGDFEKCLKNLVESYRTVEQNDLVYENMMKQDLFPKQDKN